jgi:hypothetical protein
LRLPTTTPGAFRSGLTMWAACRPLARLAYRTVYHLVGILGPAPMMARDYWHPPVDPDHWSDMLAGWRSWFGRFDSMAVYSPRQAERNGMALMLLRGDQAVGFVKLRPDADFSTEIRVLKAVSDSRSFLAPEVVGGGTEGGWEMLGLSAIGGHLHSPRLRRPPREVADEIGALLSPLWSNDREGIPRHWVPMHGDMGPWNLRQPPRGRPILFDWEHARLGPPGGDLVFHAAACAALHIRGAFRPREAYEAIEFWRKEIRLRFGAGHRDRTLARQMIEVLDRM